MHLCFPMKIKKATYKESDIDDDSLTVNIFFCALDKGNKRNKIWKR